MKTSWSYKFIAVSPSQSLSNLNKIKMNTPQATFSQLEAEHNQLLNEHSAQSLLTLNKIKSIQKRMLKSPEITSLLSAFEISSLEAKIDGSNINTMREFYGELSQVRSQAQNTKNGEDARRRMGL